jgi:hypothetical protein
MRIKCEATADAAYSCPELAVDRREDRPHQPFRCGALQPLGLFDRRNFRLIFREYWSTLVRGERRPGPCFVLDSVFMRLAWQTENIDRHVGARIRERVSVLFW